MTQTHLAVRVLLTVDVLIVGIAAALMDVLAAIDTARKEHTAHDPNGGDTHVHTD